MERLSEKEWKAVPIDDLADVDSGRDIYVQDRIKGKTPYVTAGTANNGIGYFVGNENDSLAANAISVNRNGAVGEAFYHPYLALYGNDCRRLTLRKDRRAGTQIFVARAVSQQKGAFSYSRKLGTARLKRLHVMLPVDDKGNPDYAYMTLYTTEVRWGMLMRYKNFIAGRLSQLEHKDIPALDEKEWKKFKAFGDDGIFDIATTSSSIDGIRLKGGQKKNLPYVTRTDNSNGIAHFVSSENLFYGYDPAGCITVGLDTQTAFWQPHDFVTGQNIQVISGNKLNQYLAQFIVPLLRSQMTAKFNWGGNGATLGRMKRLEIMLPVTDGGQPDYEYMEQYAKNMMLRKYEQYLAFIDRQSSAEEVNV